MLAELGRAVAPGVAIYVAPAGASVEPLGALRRALVRALVSRPYPDDPELAPVLDMFLGGIGASIEQAAAMVGAFLRPKAPAEPPGALLIDDAGDIDAESLEACAQFVAWTTSPFHVFVRIDATDQLPAAFAALPAGLEIELGPLAQGRRRSARARGDGRGARRQERTPDRASRGVCAARDRGGDRLRAHHGGRRVARRAGVAPHGGVARGEAGAAPRAGSPKRAKATASDERGVLATIALLGGEAPLDTVRDALALVEPAIAVEEEVQKLTRRQWLVRSLPGWVALPSRTHRDTIADLLDEAPRRVLHRAIADVLEQSEGELGCAEAANHAVKGGDGERGARLALRAARAAQAAGMAKSASRLLTLARLADPKCEPLTRQQLLTSLPPPIPPPSAPPSSRARAPAPPPPPPPARSSRSVVEELPTQRLSPLDAAQAKRLLQAVREDEHDSDFPDRHQCTRVRRRAPGDRRSRAA